MFNQVIILVIAIVLQGCASLITYKNNQLKGLNLSNFVNKRVALRVTKKNWNRDDKTFRLIKDVNIQEMVVSVINEEKLLQNFIIVEDNVEEINIAAEKFKNIDIIIDIYFWDGYWRSEFPIASTVLSALSFGIVPAWYDEEVIWEAKVFDKSSKENIILERKNKYEANVWSSILFHFSKTSKKMFASEIKDDIKKKSILEFVKKKN